MICPNCGKNIDQNADLCPYCKKTTHFSSRMKYYPRSTPLNPTSTPPVQQIANDSREMKAVLSGMADLPKKKDLRSAKNNILLIAGSLGIICLVVLLICVLLLSAKIGRNNQSVQESLSSLDGKLNDLVSSYQDLKQTVDAGNDWTKSATEAISEDAVMVIMYCQYPDETKNSPLCVFAKKGTGFRLPDLSFSGYRFLGWEKDYGGSGIVIKPGDPFTVNADDTVELYAAWQATATSSPQPTPTPNG